VAETETEPIVAGQKEGLFEVLVQLSDQELIARCREGDIEAFGQLFARYERLVYRFAYRMLGDADDADDIKQETFLKAYRALPSFRGECSLLTWLLKVAGNLCRDRLKSRARRSEVELMPEMETELRDQGDFGADPAELLERKDLVSTAHKVLNNLPDAHREMILMRDVEGLSYQQIADILDCSVASVKLRLFRARRGFKDRMESLLRIR
jgi:RNA polymerase sigma-70 factor (ECF subfamily)